MSIQQSINTSPTTNVSELLKVRRTSDTRLFMLILFISLSLTPPLALAGTSNGITFVLGIIAVLIAVALVVRWPIVGLLVVLGCATLIEQDPDFIMLKTSQLPIFYWPPSLAGLPERPIGFFILLIFLVVITTNFISRKRILLGGKLILPYLIFMLCVAGGVIHGLASGGDLKIIVIEVRPFWYMFVSYLLAYNLVTRIGHIRTIFWMIILDAGVKGIQGTYIYIVKLHTHLQGYHEIMAHEESFFFVALLLLIILFCMHYKYRPQLYAALIVMPFVVIATVANQRRTDYVALVVGVVVAWALIFMIKPRARKALVIGMAVAVVVSVGYVLAFAQASGIVAYPARSVMSVISPSPSDTTDINSNLYRDNENYDLKYTVSQNPLGMGFGKMFLQPKLLQNATYGDPTNGGNPYQYVPHNTIYWVWMRLGPIGYLAFWYLLGAAIIRGCMIARQLRDRYLQLVAIYIVAVTFMEVIVAYSDYQLYFYRNVIYMGLLLGILMKLPALDQSKEVPVYESTHSDSKPAVPLVGSQHSQLPSVAGTRV